MGKNNKQKMVAGTSQTTAALVRKQVKDILASQAEMKSYTIAFTGLATTTGGSVSPITQGIIQGDSNVTRDGAQIIVKRLIVRHHLALGTGASTSQRVIIVWDNMADNTSPNVTDVLSSASYISGYAPVKQVEHKFKILMDKVITTTINGSNCAVDSVWTFRLNHKVTYDGTTDVNAANGKGSMFVLFIADNTTSTYAASYQVDFTDS